ncbi:ABC transporter ATP-binding protein, partial [Streptomyces sp. NPDC002454]
QGVVDYRSTVDQKAGLHQQPPPGALPPLPDTPVAGQGQPGWYAPPPPQPGAPAHANPYATPAPPPGAAAPSDPTHTP